jgi:hypothetical protein
MKNTTLFECSAGTWTERAPEGVVGKGGGVHLKSPTAGITQILPLSLLFFNVSFIRNQATIGRDVYILCYEAEKQVDESHFQINMKDAAFVQENAIWGTDTTSLGERDIM